MRGYDAAVGAGVEPVVHAVVGARVTPADAPAARTGPPEDVAAVLVGYADGAQAGAERLGTRGAAMARVVALGLPAPAGVTAPVGSATLADPAGAAAAVATLGATGGLLRLSASAAVEVAGLPPDAACLGMSEHDVDAHDAVLGRPGELHAAWAATLRLVAEHALDVPAAAVRGVALDHPDPRDQVPALLDLCAAEGSGRYPAAPAEQVALAARALLARWASPRAARARKSQGVADDAGLALHLETQPLGPWDRSGYGTAVSRDAATGAFAPRGRFHRGVRGAEDPAGEGEDLAGLPAGRDELAAALRALELSLHGMVEVRFELAGDGVRVVGVRADRHPPARALVALSVELRDAGATDRATAVRAVGPEAVGQILHPRLRLTGDERLLARGLPASPGAACGAVALSSERAVELVEGGSAVVLVATETTPADLSGMLAADAIVTSRGGSASHAAVVARGIGRPAVCGAAELTIDPAARVVRGGGHVVREGDVVSVDGWSGAVYAGEVPVGKAEPMPELVRLLEWADGLRRLGVRANADTAEQTRAAIALGAEGIGLCRTEHQFLGERLPLVQDLLLARDEAGERRALAGLAAAQREDYRELLLAVGDRPVTVRLLDAPLHEFLPAGGAWAADGHAAAGLHEVNPMMGVRGVRLAALHHGLYPAQAGALFEAWLDVAAEGVRPRLEVMIPLVSTVEELRFAAALVRAEARAVGERTGVEVPYRIGTMVETPRAALLAGRLAAEAEFLSFGTNDLTQLTFGLSRDDVERRLMTPYLDQGLLAANPFVALDPDGVGELVALGVARARAARPDVKLGLCGEHGGDPGSVELCHRLGLDYVSCSPQRVPIARLAAARAAVGEPRVPA
jgi:pyruvate,orthophosphate dikinase